LSWKKEMYNRTAVVIHAHPDDTGLFLMNQ